MTRSVEQVITVRTQTAGTITVPVDATDAPATIGKVDLIIFCTKTYDIVTAAEQMRPLVGPGVAILTIQNGVDNAERAAAALGVDVVHAAAIYFSATLESPGVIAKVGGLGGRVVFGNPAGSIGQRTEQIAEVLRGAGFEAQIHADIRAALWEKFLGVILGSISVLTRLPNGPLVACAETRELMRGMLIEGVAVARASGVVLADEFVEKTLGIVQQLPPQLRPSQYFDIAAGRRLEIDALNGTIVRIGREHGIATPLNFALYAALKPFADGTPKFA